MIEDKDEPAGYGTFWGEVQTNMHKALGCLGTVTNGSIRDIGQVAEDFLMPASSITPSHADSSSMHAGCAALPVGQVDADVLHHALILMVEDVTVQHELADVALVAGADHDGVDALRIRIGG
jgi:regulator of RNase E activity RraA